MKTSYLTNSSFPESLSFIGNIDLSSGNYTIASGGIYKMIHGTDSAGSLNFPNPASSTGARIVITNTDYVHNSNGNITGSYIPKQGATNTNITEIVVGKTYNFVSDGQYWRNLPLTGISSFETTGAVEDTYTITKAGVYSVSPNYAGTMHVDLPDPALLDGQTLKFFNTRTGSNFNLYNYPIYGLDGSANTPPYAIGYYSFLEIISVGGKWRFVQTTSA